MNNWYNLAELSEDLLQLQVHTVGTLCSIRDELVEIRNLHNLGKHDVIASTMERLWCLHGKTRE